MCHSESIPELVSQDFICCMGKLGRTQNIPVVKRTPPLPPPVSIWKFLAYRHKYELNILFLLCCSLCSCFVPCQYASLLKKEGLKFCRIFYVLLFLRFFFLFFCLFFSCSLGLVVFWAFLAVVFVVFIFFFKATLLIKCSNRHTFEYLNETVPSNTNTFPLLPYFSRQCSQSAHFFRLQMSSFVPYLSVIGLLRGFGKNPSLQSDESRSAFLQLTVSFPCLILFTNNVR